MELFNSLPVSGVVKLIYRNWASEILWFMLLPGKARVITLYTYQDLRKTASFEEYRYCPRTNFRACFHVKWRLLRVLSFKCFFAALAVLKT